MNPLKGGKFDICFHRRDAEYAEDLFYFLLSTEPRKKTAGCKQGRKQKSVTLRGINLLYVQNALIVWFDCSPKLRAFLCDLCGSSEAGGLYLLTYPHSIAWTISIAEGLRD